MRYSFFSPKPKTIALSRQFVQPRFRLLEVSGVKAFGKPAVHLRQLAAGFVVPFLVLPQPGQAHGGAQLERPGLLTARHLESVLQAHFCLEGIGNDPLQQQHALESIQLRLIELFSSALDRRQGVGKHAQSSRALAPLSHRLPRAA